MTEWGKRELADGDIVMLGDEPTKYRLKQVVDKNGVSAMRLVPLNEDGTVDEAADDDKE